MMAMMMEASMEEWKGLTFRWSVGECRRHDMKLRLAG